MSIKDMTRAEAEAEDIPRCKHCGQRMVWECWLNDWICGECGEEETGEDEE